MRIRLELDPLDTALPEGVMNDSTIILYGPPGTGKSVVVANIAWNLLLKERKVIYFTLDDSPQAIGELFSYFGWDIDRYIEKGLFNVIDGFSYRLGRYKQPYHGIAREVAPGNLDDLVYATIDTIRDLGADNGLLVIDSLNEIVSKLGVPQCIEYIKTVRALASKLHGMLVIMVLHSTTETIEELEKETQYIADGVIETRIDENLQAIGIPLKQLLVRKMRGVPTNPLWIPYIITSKGVSGVDTRKLAELVKQRMKEAESLRLEVK